MYIYVYVYRIVCVFIYVAFCLLSFAVLQMIYTYMYIYIYVYICVSGNPSSPTLHKALSILPSHRPAQLPRLLGYVLLWHLPLRVVRTLGKAGFRV